MMELHTGLSPQNIAALFGAMAMLAAVPSVSVLAVCARAAASGFLHGVSTAAGVVAGDIVFILLAMFGLALLAGAMGDAFHLLRYPAGAYLVWLGIRLWRSGAGGDETARATGAKDNSLAASFMTGLLITLGDQKAVLFYLGFLPAFINLAAVTPVDVVVVSAIAVAAVGGVKIGYAWMAHRAGAILGSGAGRVMNRLAAALMCAVGLFMLGTAHLG